RDSGLAGGRRVRRTAQTLGARLPEGPVTNDDNRRRRAWQDRHVRWLGVMLVAACGAKAPLAILKNEPAPIESTITREKWKVRFAEAPRPTIDVDQYLPDFHDELRWPLSGMNHPSLEPRFPVANELAIGVDWQTLCARGVQNRTSPTQKELLSYLRGWCEVQRRDVDGACAHLTPLIGAMTFGMPAAVRQDLANILVDHGDAD